jgi:hypothetical protein
LTVQEGNLQRRHFHLPKLFARYLKFVSLDCSDRVFDARVSRPPSRLSPRQSRIRPCRQPIPPPPSFLRRQQSQIVRPVGARTLRSRATGPDGGLSSCQGNLQGSVTVTAAAPFAKTENAAVGQTIVNRRQRAVNGDITRDSDGISVLHGH